MRRVRSLFVIACIMICSCKSKSVETTSSALTERISGVEALIETFYKAYCSEGDADVKTDSILSVYCTDELREYVMDCVGEYDFVLDGGIYSDIHAESFRVTRRNERYLVYFEYRQWPQTDEPGKDSLYVMLNKENRISYIIRPDDGYRIPNAYSAVIPDLYSYYEYVDLGLSVNWATCNIGSSPVNPHYSGQYFAWGETEPRDNFDESNPFAERQKHYFASGITVLEPGDDAATVQWGPEWRMPTREEFQELMNNCLWEWIELEGGSWVYKVTGTNGNSIILPAGGFRIGKQWQGLGERLFYWTSTCNADDPTDEPCAWEFISMPDRGKNSQYRSNTVSSVFLRSPIGINIRPVTEQEFIPIDGIALDRKKLELTIGDEYILKASFIPQDASKKGIRWRSGNSAVACVDRNGKVTAVSDGKCTITAVCGEFNKECQVTVIRPKDYVPLRQEKVTTIYEFGKEVNSTLVEGLQDFADSLELKEVFKTHIGDKSKGFDITVSDFTGQLWKNDPGDFRMITIENASGQYRFKNYDWVYEELFDNNLFYCHQVDKSRYLLFLRCFTYGCCAGVLTVLAIDENGARVVYNQQCKLDDLNKDPFSITIESDYPEGVSKYETHYYPAYNLFVEDGALKMKSVELLRE